jgi:hypothetical protein
MKTSTTLDSIYACLGYVPLTSLVFLLGLLACAPPKGQFGANPNGTPVSATSFSGHIIVSSNTTRAVVLLDSNFNFVRTLLQFDTISGDIPGSIEIWDAENILLSVRGNPRVIRLNLRSSVTLGETFISNVNLTGTLAGLARMTTGDIVVSETATVERFGGGVGAWSRVSTGGWPATLAQTNDIVAMSSDRLFVCAGGATNTATIRTSAFVASTTATSSAPAPVIAAGLAAQACAIDASGRLIVAWSGGSDAIRVYNSALTATVWTYINAVGLTAPVAVGVRPNGNVLAVDTTNVVFELNASDGSLVRTYSSPYIATANYLRVIP